MPDKTVTRSRKYLRIALATVGAILLSAVGSGVWASFGRPFVDWIARAIITVIDPLIGTYKDSIYREASRGFQEHPASMLYVFALLTVSMICIMLVVTVGHLRGNSPSKFGPSRMSRVFLSRTFSYVLVLYVFSTTAVSVSRHLYVRAVVVYAQSSIDRLAPYLTDAEEEELLAQFRNVQIAEDYYAFYGRLLEIYEAHGLDHRSVSPL